MIYHKIHITLFILYMIGMTALMIWLGLGITPDRYALMLTLGVLFIGRLRKFLLDWLPFLFILISYDFLRSLADHLNTRVHYMELIWADKWLFGVVPTVFLQEKLYQAGKLQWFDFMAVFFYFLHFALPLAFGFILWLKNRIYFKKFAANLLVLSYAAFATYVIFPASPPWLSNKMGFLPGVTKILDIILKSFPQRLDLPTIYNNFDPNTVAAVPSLHAAYPFLVLILACKFFGKKGLFFIPYVLGTWFSIVYLGEHYVIDVILGVTYTLATLFITSFVHYHLPILALKLKWWYKLLAMFTNEKLLGMILIIFVVAASGYFAFIKFKQEVINVSASPSPSPAGLDFLFNKTPTPQQQAKVSNQQQAAGKQVKPQEAELPLEKNKKLAQFPGILKPEILQNKKAIIQTAKGIIELQIYPEASMAASNFLILSSNGFYDGLTFHRVEPGFVIQGGDPLGNGTGGPGYQFPDEPVIGDYKKGTVAMANAGPNTNGSQFFILLEDHPELPKNYTIFGQVISGMDVVGKIAVGDVMQKVTVQSLQ